MDDITLVIWIENQPDFGYDLTEEYISVSRWEPPTGVTFEGNRLSGDPHATFAAYVQLRRILEDLGHGDGCEDLDPPSLTACPLEMMEEGYQSAGESLAHVYSIGSNNWDEFYSKVGKYLEANK